MVGDMNFEEVASCIEAETLRSSHGPRHEARMTSKEFAPTYPSLKLEVKKIRVNGQRRANPSLRMSPSRLPKRYWDSQWKTSSKRLVPKGELYMEIDEFPSN